MKSLYKDVVKFIRKQFNTDDYIPLHVPVFIGNEKKYLLDCIETGYVSSVGEYVVKFEKMISEYVKIPYPAKTTHYFDGVEMYLHFVKKDTTNKIQYIDKIIDLYNQNAKCNGEDANNRAYQAYYMYSNGYDMLKSYKVFEQSLLLNPNNPPPITAILEPSFSTRFFELEFVIYKIQF